MVGLTDFAPSDPLTSFAMLTFVLIVVFVLGSVLNNLVRMHMNACGAVDA